MNELGCRWMELGVGFEALGGNTVVVMSWGRRCCSCRGSMLQAALAVRGCLLDHCVTWSPIIETIGQGVSMSGIIWTRADIIDDGR